MTFSNLNEDTSTFSYRFRDNGIHQFVFRAVTPVEVNKWIDTTQRMKPIAIAHNLHIRSLYHMRGVLPSPYAVRNALETIRQLPKTMPTSTALLVNDSNIVIILVQMILRQAMPHALQSRQIFFQEDEALA